MSPVSTPACSWKEQKQAERKPGLTLHFTPPFPHMAKGCPPHPTPCTLADVSPQALLSPRSVADLIQTPSQHQAEDRQ